MTQKIPIFSVQEQYSKIATEVEQAVIDVLRSGNYILGENVARLEAEISSACDTNYGVGVANGTDALLLALWALGIGPGDEVITTPFTFAATVEAITLRGAEPVFVDVDDRTFNIDAKLIESKITDNTRAILPVHLYGQPADMDPLLAVADRYDLKVIEDNAQGIGATYKGKATGCLGDAACISFYPTKNLGACGDAGMIVTNDEELAAKIKTLRAHGSKRRYYHDELGVNSRLDEVQAAILLAKLPYLRGWTDSRQRIADMYRQVLGNTPGIILPNSADNPNSALAESLRDSTHVWHQYTIRIAHPTLPEMTPAQSAIIRDAFKQELENRDITTMCYYPVPLHLQNAFNYLGYQPGDFPVTEKLAAQVLSLPMYPELTKDQVEIVGRSIQEISAKLFNIVVPTPAQPIFTG